MEYAAVARLTPTSYVILGYLAFRPWTAYELTKQMNDAVRLAWSRTESRIYQEPKNLVARGLATAEEETVNGRRRTVYSITDAGHEELARWFGSESAPPTHEFEALLRTGFAEFGTREETVADLERAAGHARAILAAGWEAYPRFLERVGADAERLHNLFVYGKFINDYVQLIVDWSEWAREEIKARPKKWSSGAAERMLAFTTPENLAAPDPELPK